MAEHVERSSAVPARAPSSPGPAPFALTDAPRVQQLAQRAAALNDARAPVQLNGKDKKTKGQKKQEKKKAVAAGKKKSKEKKIAKIKKSMGGYNESDLTEAQLDTAIRSGKLSKMRAGHLSKKKTSNMNAGTVKTLAGLTKTAKDNRAKENKKAESDDDAYEEDDAEELSDYEDTTKPANRKDDDDPPPGAAGLGGGDGITA